MPRTAPRSTATSPRRRPRRSRQRRSFLWRHRRAFFWAGFASFTLVAVAAYLFVRVPLPAAHVQAETTFLTDINGQRLASLHPGEDRVNVALAEVPQVVQDAVLAVEDRNYYRHSGVDPRGVIRALWQDLRGGALQGGSTLTQQYARNTYIGRERTLWRKIREAVLAVKIEREFDKREILERYLNTVYFGRGAYGVAAASRAYFGKDVHIIGLKEAAYLAGLIRAPQYADALRDPGEATRRRDSTLAAMRQAGLISGSDQQEVATIPLTDYVINQQELEPTVVMESKGTRYFVEYVRRELEREFGERAVIGSGWRVKTTLDLRMQEQAYDAVHDTLDRDGDPAGALVAIDDNGQVKAMVGGKDWHTSKVNLAVGRDGGGSGRQAGSVFKAMLLAEIVREGYTVESAFPAPAEIVLKKADRGNDWKVANYEGQSYGGALNLVDATRNSVNTVYAQAMLAIGPDKLQRMAEDLGVKASLPEVNSLVLGTADVSLLDLATAFSTFANRGERVEPRVILEVRDAKGNVIQRDTPPTRTRVLSTDEADVVNFVLRQVIERGTGTGAAWGRPGLLIGKTGTTQDFGDALMVGATSKLTTAVWMGHPEGRSRSMQNVRGRPVTGGGLPATIFRRFMQAATRGLDLEPFRTVNSFPGKVLDAARVPVGATTTVPADDDDDDRPSTTVAPPAPTTSSSLVVEGIGGDRRSPPTTSRGGVVTTTTTTTPPRPPPQPPPGREPRIPD